MSERLHKFNTANAVDSNTQAELINNTGIENLVLDQYSNGANHFYTVNAEGKKTPISQDSILEAYGYGANPVQTEAQADATANTVDTEEPQKNPAEDTHESLQARDRASIKEHATWHRKVSTTKTKTSKNALVPEASPLIPVEDDLTPDDLAYNAWLKENATENKAKTVAQVVKDRDAEAAAAERKERLRSMAALSSRVKTGSATGQEAAYYYSLQEMSENQDQEEPTSRVNIPVRDGNGKSKDSGDTKNKFDF